MCSHDKSLHPVIRLLAGLFLLTASIQAMAQGVSRADAEALLTQLDRAVAARDTDAITAVLSEQVAIDATIRMGGQTQRFTFGKVDYVQSLEEGWAQVTEYAYRRDNQTIEVIGDKAVVTADVSESTKILGQGFESRSREIATIERVEGLPMITILVVETDFDVRPR